MSIAATWRNSCDLQSEPAIARAQIDHLHARLQANARKHARRVGPQCLPPAGGRHFSPFKQSRFARHKEVKSQDVKNVRFWHKADITIALTTVRFSGKADIRVRFCRAVPASNGGPAWETTSDVVKRSF